MAWQPSELTREQLEERRMRGAELLREGKLTKVAIAAELGVTRGTVQDWARKLAYGGKRLLVSRKAPGKDRKLDAKQEQRLARLLARGACANGFDTERWTLARVADLVRREFKVDYHFRSMGRVLRRIGWSVQQPAAQATERDEKLIRAWLSKDWSRIKKSAAQAAKYHISR
jgi:putative transposase